MVTPPPSPVQPTFQGANLAFCQIALRAIEAIQNGWDNVALHPEDSAADFDALRLVVDNALERYAQQPREVQQVALFTQFADALSRLKVGLRAQTAQDADIIFVADQDLLLLRGKMSDQGCR